MADRPIASSSVRRALLDRADHRNHIGVSQTQRLGLPKERVTDVEQRRSDPRFARRARHVPASDQYCWNPVSALNAFALTSYW